MKPGYGARYAHRADAGMRMSFFVLTDMAFHELEPRLEKWTYVDHLEYGPGYEIEQEIGNVADVEELFGSREMNERQAKPLDVAALFSGVLSIQEGCSILK